MCNYTLEATLVWAVILEDVTGDDGHGKNRKARVLQEDLVEKLKGLFPGDTGPIQNGGEIIKI